MGKSIIRYALMILTVVIYTSLTAQNLDLENITISTVENYSASSISAGPDVTISSTGELTLSSNTLTIKPQFFVINGGKLTVISETAAAGIKQNKNIIPGEFIVNQNYPNPFNPTTQISYVLPKADRVEIKIYNLTGQMVTTLLSEHQAPGSHSVTWNGTDFSGKKASSGIYYYRVTLGSLSVTKRMILIK